MIDVRLVHPSQGRPDYHHIWGADDLTFFSLYDGLTHFRLTALGAWVLGVSRIYRPAVPSARPLFRVMASQEIRVTVSLTQSERLALARLAEPIDEQQWRLSTERILGMVEAGGSIARARDFLSNHTTHRLPAAITDLFDALAARTDAIQPQGLARLLQCKDAKTAREIANDPKTRALCLLAGKRHLVVRAADEARFQSALKRLGYVLPSTGAAEG